MEDLVVKEVREYEPTEEAHPRSEPFPGFVTNGSPSAISVQEAFDAYKKQNNAQQRLMEKKLAYLQDALDMIQKRLDERQRQIDEMMSETRIR